MKKPVTITIAEREFNIRPLTLGTIRDLDLARTGVIPTDPREREAYFFDQYVDTVALALVEDYPEMTREALLKLRTDLSELVVAYKAILELSGLIVTPDPPKGAPATE